jgi:GNAT superfamily N-acetyltransferase
MRLYEITAWDQYDFTGGKESLNSEANHLKQILKARKLVPNTIFQLPERLKYSEKIYYSILPYNGATLYLTIGKNLIGYITHGYPVLFPTPAVKVGAITVDEDWRGMGLGQLLYQLLFYHYKAPLLADDTHTPSGKRMWAELSKAPNVQVMGYVRLPDRDINAERKLQYDDGIMRVYSPISDPLINKWMKLGGEYLGKDSLKNHYLGFPVKRWGNELKALMGKTIKLYHDDDKVDDELWTTGLVAFKE